MQEMAMEIDFKKYVEALKEERRKVTVFRRELPLCLELITKAIESCTQQLSGTTTEGCNGGLSDCSEQTSGQCPVLEEFIPIKKELSFEFSGEERATHKRRKDNKNREKNKHVGQSDWLKSAQLWNPDPDVVEDLPEKTTAAEVKKNGGAFQPFHREKTTGKTNLLVENEPAAATVICAAETASRSSTRREEKEEHGKRKLRRSWSPGLHRRFLTALQQLGGSHVATPKQIRELMKVDGLTNDEVKSHLQKYRLHTRRSSHENGVKQSPQYVVVGGIWVPPSEYAVAPGTTVSGDGNEFYVVPATVSQGGQGSAVERPRPMRLVQASTEGRQVSLAGEDGGARSNSPATSSSTRS